VYSRLWCKSIAGCVCVALVGLLATRFIFISNGQEHTHPTPSTPSWDNDCQERVIAEGIIEGTGDIFGAGEDDGDY
jgi:hypothetical protein